MKLGLRFRLVVFTFCLILTVGGSMLGYSVYLGRDNILTAFEREAKESASIIAESILNDLYFFDLKGIAVRLAAARANTDIRRIDVMDLEGVVIAEMGKGDSRLGRQISGPLATGMRRASTWLAVSEGGVFSVAGPVSMPDGSRRGYLRIEFDLDEPQARAHHLTMGIFVMTLVCLVAGGAVAVGLSARFTRPISEMAHAARQIGGGMLETRIPIRRNDELGALAQSINELAASRQKTESALVLANRRVEKSLDELSGLYAAMTPLALSGSVDEILAGVIDKLIDATGADAALVRLWDKRLEQFAMPAQKGFPQSFIEAAKLKGAGSAVDLAFRTGQPVIAADVATDERIKGKSQLQAGFLSCAFLPLKVGSKVRGIVHLASRELGFFTAEQESRLMAIMHQMGVAIENRELFDKIRSTNDSLAATNQKLDRQTQALLCSNAELEQFAYVASHDLQEPLRMITSYTTLLAKRYKGKLDQDAEEFIGFAVDGAKRMQGLIQDLLTYSRVGSKAKEFTTVDCESVLSTALNSLALAIAESGAQIEHDPLPKVRGDAGQLGQLFQNLLGNAIKYRNGKAPEVHVSCARQAEQWVFSVTDNGIGIDPQYAEKVFAIFQRLHTRDEYEGSGIGLAVCKKIVERHGGKIWLESELGKGATFFFTVPTPPADGRLYSSSQTI